MYIYERGFVSQCVNTLFEEGVLTGAIIDTCVGDAQGANVP